MFHIRETRACLCTRVCVCAGVWLCVGVVAVIPVTNDFVLFVVM